MRAKTSVIALMLSLIIGCPAPAAWPSAALAFAQNPQDDLDLYYDLATRFGSSLAAKDQRHRESNRRWQRRVEELRIQQRHSHRAARVRIAALERELQSLSWATEPRFRDAMIAYRELVLTALRTATSEELAGWRLIARGDPAAGLELLRANYRLQAEADRKATAAAHDAIDLATREIAADRLRIIGIEALKAVESRQIPVGLAIEDWLKVVETGVEYRGDRLLLANLYILDGDQANAALQRQLASARPDPPDRISSLLDDLFGVPSEIVFRFLEIAPESWSQLAELAGPIRQAFEHRRDISPQQRERLFDMFEAVEQCLGTLNWDAASTEDSTVLSDDGGRCIERLVVVSTSITEMNTTGPPPRPESHYPGSEPSAFQIAMSLAEVLTASTALAFSADAEGRAQDEAVQSRRTWGAFGAAIAPLADLCRRPSIGHMGVADRCARIRLHFLAAQHTQGQVIPQSETEAIADAIVQAIAKQRQALETAWMQRNELLAADSPVNRAAAEQLSVLSPEAAQRVADALVAAELDAYPHLYAHATDAFVALGSIQWYAQFSSKASSKSRFSNADLFRSAKQILAPRPSLPGSCALFVEFVQAVANVERPLTGGDVTVLEEALPLTDRCGLIPVPPGSENRLPGQTSFRFHLRQVYGMAALGHAVRRDLASTRLLARLVAYGGPAAPEKAQVFTTNDLPSHFAHDILKSVAIVAGRPEEAAAAASVLFKSAQALAASRGPCLTCPGETWRPDVSDAGVALGLTLEAVGDIEGAMSTYQSVVDGGPGTGGSWMTAHLRLGWHLFKRGRPEAAAPLLRSYVEHGRRGGGEAGVAAAESPEIADPLIAREAAELAEVRRTVAKEGFDVALWLLSQAELATGDVKEALGLLGELQARRFAALDKGGSDELLPFLIWLDGERSCSVEGRARSARAERRCRVRLAYELARRKSRIGVAEPLAWMLDSLSADPSVTRDRQGVCRTLRRAEDPVAAAALIAAFRIRCG